MDSLSVVELQEALGSLLSLLHTQTTSSANAPSICTVNRNHRHSSETSTITPSDFDTASSLSREIPHQDHGSSSFTSDADHEATNINRVHRHQQDQYRQQYRKNSTREGYEIRRAARRLDRAIQSIGTQLQQQQQSHSYSHSPSQRNTTDTNNDPLQLLDAEEDRNIYRDPRQLLRDDLIEVLSILPRALELSFSCISLDVWQLYNNSACGACRILLGYYFDDGDDLQLHHDQIDALLGRVAELMVWKQNSDNNNNIELAEDYEKQRVLLISLVNANLTGATSTTTISAGSSTRTTDKTQLPLYVLLPIETIQLLQLFLPQCMNDLSVRWNAHTPSNNDGISLECQEQQDGPVQLRILVGYLLQHLSTLIVASTTSTSADIANTSYHDHRRDDGNDARNLIGFSSLDWVEQILFKELIKNDVANCENEDGRGAISTTTAKQKAEDFIEACRDFGVEATEYALDVLDGASVVLASYPSSFATTTNTTTTTTTMPYQHNARHDQRDNSSHVCSTIHTPTTCNNSKNEEEEAGAPSQELLLGNMINRRQQCIATLHDVMRHTSIATSTAEVMKDGLDIAIPLKSLLVAFATSLVASAGYHRALLHLDENAAATITTKQGGRACQDENLNVDTIRTAAGELVVQLARAVLQDKEIDILAAQRASLSSESVICHPHYHDRDLEDAIVIALFQDLEMSPRISTSTAADSDGLEHKSLIECIVTMLSPTDLVVARSSHLPHPSTRPPPPKRPKTTARRRRAGMNHTAHPVVDRNLVQAIQAAAMSSFVLPNYRCSSKNHNNNLPSKKDEIHRSVTHFHQQLFGKIPEAMADPWQSLLSRKMSEEGFPLEVLSVHLDHHRPAMGDPSI